ncbi:MAG: glutamate--tRNA ligase [Bacteroides sp.]|nr:glutamate--tRNA ligase [Bacteroides sp.]MCM1379844.1 glutamate--tRNA ligase [Bacteroides sp.]MCM1446124.1 glutamate--tRNA ligase [Prevotella sp.]
MDTTDREVRVRFAPSPTGPLHIGGVRTALYNYLFARQHGGTMILRIEDTDSQRFVPGAEAYINEALHWLGIEIDEGVAEGGPYGPYKQSERRDIYRQHVKQLLDNGKAYIAFDTPEELNASREATPNFQYDARTRGNMRNSLTMPAEEVQALIDAGTPYVVRFKIDGGRAVEVNDLIRGKVVIKSDILDDKVLYKSSDDLPTYHLANIVDDHLMKVSHVIRGEEWLPSAPLHVLLYEAFGWADTMPAFVHLPLLLKPDGKGKLSKRDGDRLGFPVFPLLWKDPETGNISRGYREDGYLPQAVVNFLALLGWNPGDDTEIMTMDELIKRFSLEHCSKSGAKFAYEKGTWFNHQYLQMLPDNELAELFKPILKEHGVNPDDFAPEYIEKAVGMVKGRINFVRDLWDNAKFFFVAPTEYEEKSVRKRWTAETPAYLTEMLGWMKALPSLSPADAEQPVLDKIKEREWHMGNVMNALRLAVVGECKGPHMFEITELLGYDEVERRVNAAIANIKPIVQ